MSIVPPGGPVPAVGPGSVVVDRYRLEQTTTSDLAEAGVWQATDVILDRPVRVTFLGGPHAAGALDAARRAALVSDPRLARVLDVGTTRAGEGTLDYVITEPYSGSTLTEIVSSGLVDAQQARAIVGEAAAALDVAAQRGVHHLALRPDAVRVDGHRVVVTGLGLDAGLAGVDGAGADGAASDARDLAALAYYCLTARWAGDSLDEPWLASGVVRPLPAQVDVTGAPVSLSAIVPHVDPTLDTVVGRTLASAPGGATSPAALADALKPWGEVSVVASLPEFVQPPAGGVPTRQSVYPAGAPGVATPGVPVRRPTGRIARSSAVGVGGMAAGAGVTGAGIAGATPPPPPPAQPYGGGYAAAPSYPPTGAQPTAQPTAYPAATAQMPPTPAQQPYAQDYGQPPEQPPAGFATESVPRRRGVNPTPIVLGLVIVAVVLMAGWALSNTFHPFSPAASSNPSATVSADKGGASHKPSPGTPSPSPTVEVRPVIAQAAQIGPAQQCAGEQPEAAPLAVDGDPSTFWFSCTYRSDTFGGLKQGIGLAVTLREAAPVTSVTLLTNSTGGNVEIRKTTADKPTDGPILAQGPIAPTTELKFAQPEVGTSFVIWITQLPQTNGQNRIELNEITLQ